MKVSGGALSSFGGNVGIGTSSPGAKLDVVGGLKATTGAFSGAVTAPSATLASGGELFFTDIGQIRSMDDNHRILFRRPENKMELREFGDLIFSPGSSGLETGKVVMLANGNVGIGTNAPSARLEVFGGALGTTAGNTSILSDVWGTTSNSVHLRTQMVRNTAGTDWTSSSLVLQRVTDVTPQAFIALNGSNVGIGTATPVQALDVKGNVNVTGGLSAHGASAISGANTLEFGAAVVGKDVNAGKIGYQTFTTGALDIVGAGATGTGRKIKFWNEGGATFAGEIFAPVVTVTGGSDVAEPYNVAGAGDVKPVPGMVVALDADHIGQMRVSSSAYDKAVAGILSGANGIAPGITLRQAGTIADGAFPVASIGRVWCYADADANGGIQVGDLLTTSDTPGHAMRATDRERRDGAVIGKAMSPLKSGKGLVLVLVSLK